MMKNEKIGIGIVHCQSGQNTMTSGFGIAFKSDNCDWSKMIDDTGEVFKYIKINDNSLIIRMIHFTKDGWYMCSMKPSLSRNGEYRASWVYFPACISLTKEGIRDIINVAESQIERTDFDETKLQNVISQYNNYDKKCPSYIIPSSQSGFAFRNTNGDNDLLELYGSIFQKEFAQYKWVVIMEKSDSLTLKNGIIDISGHQIFKSIIITPTENDFEFTAYLDERKFERAVRITDGEVLTIVYKRDGYKDIPKIVRKQEDLNISSDECYKKIYKSKFIVRNNENQKNVSNAKITALNGQDCDSYWLFPEKFLGKAEFKVEAEGFITKDHIKIDLTRQDENVFEIEPQKFEYKFSIPLKRAVVRGNNLTEIEITIISQFEIKESPIDGYICVGQPRVGHKNLLTFSSNNTTQKGYPYTHGGQNITPQGSKPTPTLNAPIKTGINRRSSKSGKIFKVIVLALGFVSLIIALFLGGVELYKKVTKSTIETEILGGTENSKSDTSCAANDKENSNDTWAAAVKYLKTDTVCIIKDKMEKYGKLEGLYDKINNYKFEELKSFIDNSELKDSILAIPVWKTIYDQVSGDKKPISDHYCKDNTITLKKYINKAFQDNQNKEKTTPKSTAQKTETRTKGEKDAHNNNGQSSPKNR